MFNTNWNDLIQKLFQGFVVEVQHVSIFASFYIINTIVFICIQLVVFLITERTSEDKQHLPHLIVEAVSAHQHKDVIWTHVLVTDDARILQVQLQ